MSRVRTDGFELPHQDQGRPGLKGTWSKALLEILGAVLFLLAVRWAVFEPYVIPSGSMIPALLVHDHILVNKFAYGLRLPFSRRYLWRWSVPVRGDVVVFRSVEDPSVYMVKRVIGLPGERLEIDGSGRVRVNGAKVEPAPEPRLEESEIHDARTATTTLTVPEGHVFVMGDNRDNSRDSRAWGPLPLDHVLGRASLVWLSCEETLRQASQVCDPGAVRWERLFRPVR